jgi:hypothetical protein
MISPAGTSGLALLVVFSLYVGAAAGATIEDLVPVVRNDGIYVSFRVTQGFDDDIEHAIETGLEVTFRYNVELKRNRGIWFDSTVARREIRATVAYDNLTKRYKLTREVDGKIDATEIVPDVDAMRRFMTSFESLRLFDLADLAPNESYYVRVRGILRERTLLLLIPWDLSTGWEEAPFDYVP